MRFLIGIALLTACLSAWGCQALRRDDSALRDYSATQAASKDDSAVSGVGQSDSASIRPASYEESAADDEDEKDGLTIDDFSPNALGKTAKKLSGQGPNREAAQNLYDRAELAYAKARQLYDQESTRPEAAKSFEKAGELYLSAAKRYPNSTLEQDALYQAGESFFFADAYDKSNHAYEKLIQQYAGTRYLDRAEARRFAIARFWLELDDFKPDNFFSYNVTNKERPKRDTDGNARRILNKIRLDDPTGKLADDATMALGNAYFRDQSYLDAADAYEDLRKTFPGSPHVFNAGLLEIRCRLEAYRGPAYDGTGVEKADRLLKAVVNQFGPKVEEHRAALDELAAEIRYRLAEREMSQARLYDRRKEYRAARLHYSKVVVDFSETTLADEARERIEEIADEPGVPPQRLKWLVDLLPEPRDQKPLFNSDVPGK